MPKHEAEAKGAGFLSATAAIKSVCTGEQWAKLLKAIAPDTAAMITSPPMPVAWIPAKHGSEIIRNAYEVAFGRRDDLLMQCAKKQLRSDLNTIYKIFVRLASPQYVIERGAKLWDTYNRHNGAVVARQTSDTSAEVRFTGVVTSFPAFWIYQRGAIVGVLEATGLKQPRAVLTSGGASEPDAVIEASWG